MQITTKAVYDWDGNLLEWEGYDYEGPVALACWGSGDGNAADQAKAQAASQQQMYTELRQQLAAQYSKQSSIYDALTKAFSPTLAAGPDQYGFSPGEQSALSTQAIEGAANAGKQAQEAANGQIAAENDTGLPSGAAAQLKGMIDQASTSQAAQDQLAIRKAGYDQGRQNYTQAAQVLGGVAAGENPLGYAGEANKANSGTLDAINLENQLNPNIWGGVLGALLPMGITALTGGLGGLATGAGFLGGAGQALGKSAGLTIPGTAPAGNPDDSLSL